MIKQRKCVNTMFSKIKQIEKKYANFLKYLIVSKKKRVSSMTLQDNYLTY